MSEQPQMVKVADGIYMDAEVENLVFLNLDEYTQAANLPDDEPIRVKTYALLKEQYEENNFEVILLNTRGEIINDTNETRS